MTFGAIEAIREAGRTIGSDGDIIILSFDAVRDALKGNPDQGTSRLILNAIR